MEAWKWIVGIGAVVGGYFFYENYKRGKALRQPVAPPAPGGGETPTPPVGGGGEKSGLASEPEAMAPAIPTGIPELDIPSFGLPEGSKLPGDAVMATVACWAPVPGAPPSPVSQSVSSPNPTGGPHLSGRASSPEWQWVGTFAKNETAAAVAMQVVADRNRYLELIAANPHKKVIAYPEVNFESICIGERFYLPKSWNAYIDQTGVPAGRSGRTEPWPS